MKSPTELAATAKTMGGIPIWGVLPGSAAARAGVRSGDIVLRVNGVETRSLEAFLSARDTSSGHMVFDVFREGELVRLSFALTSSLYSPEAQA